VNRYFYAWVDADGKILGVQQTATPPEAMPPGWRQVPEGINSSTHYFVGEVLTAYTAEQLAALRAGPPATGFDWSVQDFAWIDVRTLEEVRQAKLREINTAFEDAAKALTAGYPEAERLTWGVQQMEALAWEADGSPTPYLDGLASARNIAPEEMRQRTLLKVRAFMAASQQLVGTRQRLEDEIAQADAAALYAISWPAL